VLLAGAAAGPPEVAAMATPAPVNRATAATTISSREWPDSLRLPSMDEDLLTGRPAGPAMLEKSSPAILGPG
jgi:hypothetical protein